MNPFLATKERPLVVGHRGVPALHQENTLAGFRRAIALGIPAIELDVRLTADRVAVVVHDDDLTRLTGHRLRVSQLTWDQLSKLRLQRELPMGVDATGSPVVARYDRPDKIPMLAEVLAECAADVLVNIELKLDPERWWPIDVSEVVARVIDAARAEQRVIVTSFDLRKLRALNRAHPALAFGFCFDDTMLNFLAPVISVLPPISASLCALDRRPGHKARRVLSRILEADLVGRLLDARLVGAEHTLIGPRTVKRLHAQGVAIGTHTIFPLGSTTGKPIAKTASSEREVERLVGLGVDWIESDDPERLLALIG